MKATTEKGFREKIRSQCRSLGVYKPEFEDAIERLAELRVRRLKLKEMYLKTGGAPVVKAKGSAIAIRNPVLDEMDKTDKASLELERELGLTPAALRRLNEAALAAKQEADPLASALAALRGG